MIHQSGTLSFVFLFDLSSRHLKKIHHYKIYIALGDLTGFRPFVALSLRSCFQGKVRAVPFCCSRSGGMEQHSPYEMPPAGSRPEQRPSRWSGSFVELLPHGTLYR